MEKKGNHTAAKASTASILSVAMVLFASHAGGGFATGNQENTYFVCSGWAGLLSLALSMAILTGIIAIAMRLYNKYDLHSYKELFEKLYHPFDKLELVFELFFYVMVIMAVSVAIAGAASALGQYFGWNYYVCIVLVGLLVFFATIFGERAVQLISTYMGTAIMICIFVAYGYGILKAGNVGHLFSVRFQNEGFSELPKAIWNAFVYAGFQCVQIPTMLHEYFRFGNGGFHASLLGKHVHEDAERIDSANADGFADYEGQLAFGRLRRDPALMSGLFCHHFDVCLRRSF